MRRSQFITGLCVVPLLTGRAEEGSVYVKDIAFLLQQVEEKAGALIKVKQMDWDALRADFTKAAAEVKTDQEHLRLMSRLMGWLNDGHAGIIESKVKAVDESNGRRFTGPRVHLVTSGETVLVRMAFKDAADAGLASGQEVLKIDGQPARKWLEEQVAGMRERGIGFSTPHQGLYAACHWGLADWEGTVITFEVKDAAGATKQVRRIRNGGPNYAPVGPIFPPEKLQSVGRQSYGKTGEGLGYIHLRDVPADLPVQLDKMLKELSGVPGLILDMRANGGGGCDHEAVFGRFLATGEKWRQYQGVGEAPFTGPMVVIVDAGVRSAGETVAGMFKEDGRAYMIGDSPTAGMSSQKADVILPSRLFTIRFSVSSNKGRFNDGRGIEGIGVPPHEVVPVKAADLFKKQDTLILRAVELLQKGFPEGVVGYKKV